MHLPVQNELQLVGLVNVQQLTMAMLHYLVLLFLLHLIVVQKVWPLLIFQSGWCMVCILGLNLG